MSDEAISLGKVVPSLSMKKLTLLAWAALGALITPAASAADITPPTLNISHAWVEKVGTVVHFKMLLDPSDDVGFTPLAGIQFRSKLNSTAALPDSTPWNTYPWERGQAFDVAFKCTSVIFEIRAIDAAGNVSPLQRRTFASPFPFSTAPNVEPKLGGIIPFTGAGMDCAGLFGGRFDDEGFGDDILQIDRITGLVSVRRQGLGGLFTVDSFSLGTSNIRDSAVADLNADGQPDLVVVAGDALKVYLNGGVVDGHLTFQETTPAGMATTGISTVLQCAVGDLTNEGKPEIVVAGTGDNGAGGTELRLGVILNNSMFNLGASNHATLSSTTVAGPMGIGDATGDGWADVIMADGTNRELVLIQNSGIGSLVGDADGEESQRPKRTDTGFALGTLPVESLAVGDVTGDGRADAVVTMHFFGSTNGQDPNDTRDHQLWQLFQGRGAEPLWAHNMQRVGRGPVGASATAFKSHVILQDLTGDRFPEILMTSKFEDTVTQMPAGVRAIRLIPKLNAQNFMGVLEFNQTGLATGSTDPHRLGTGRFSGNSKRDILLANGGTPPLQWVFNTYTELSKPMDLAGGVSTDADEGGTAGANGTLSYFEYPGGQIRYSLTYVNNTEAALSGVTVESALPADFTLAGSDAGSTVSGAGAARVIRWTTDIPAGSSGIKNFTVRLATTAKVGANLAPKIALKQGTKALVTGTMPSVKVGAVNFFVMPTSPGQPWTFTYKPDNLPSGAVVTLQSSTNGSDWLALGTQNGVMTAVPGTNPPQFTRTAVVLAGPRVFRAMSWSPDTGYKFSTIFNNLLLPTTLTKISTKSPPKSGQTWTFIASQAGTAENLSVRFQSTETPGIEGSWTDLPIYSPAVRKGAVWTVETVNVPSGDRYFRAISAAPGWVDSISASFGSIPVTASALSIAPFTRWHMDFVDPAKEGKPATLYATVPAVKGIQVRFQTKYQNEDESKWTDLPTGALSQAGNNWTLKNTTLPAGVRDFRAIARAPGYYEQTTEVYSFEVLPPPLPQMATYFGGFVSPTNGSLVKVGTSAVALTLFDFNGVQRVYLETGASASGPFKAIKNSDLTQVGDTVTYTTNLAFSGTGVLYIRAAVVDGYDPSATAYSPAVMVNIGQGGGTQVPAFTAFSPTFTQSTLKTRGSVKIKLKIGDDKQVHRATLYRSNAGGNLGAWVGEMVRVGNSNPADFSQTDLNLDDGTYYYRVVASDYDGNEVVSSIFGPYTITTPQPPPPPANINVAVSSRFAGPSVPKGKYNYDYLAYPTATKLQFDFSSLPAGQKTFHIYRVKDADGTSSFLTRNQSVWTSVTTKVSGTQEFPRPFWTIDSKNPYAGEGTYRIVVSQNGSELTEGVGVREFTIGHAWNLPDTFTDLDYGLYWFKTVNDGLRCRDNQDDEYFDRSKPTVIYVHGWQPGEAKLRRRESWYRQDAQTDSVMHDCCKIWKDKGYNVGIFHWNQFGDLDGTPHGTIFSQANIYYIATEEGLPDSHSMIHALSAKKGESSRVYEPDGTGSLIEGKTVVDLFLDDLRRCMAGYSTVNREFRMIGHSLGTQVTGRTCKLLLDYPQWNVPVPTRIALLELAQVGVNNINVPGLQTQWIRDLVDSNKVALECYQSTNLQTLLGATAAFVGDIHDMGAYARFIPDYLGDLNVLKSATKSHNEIVRWYMESVKGPEFPCWSYLGPYRSQYHGTALSAATPRWRVKELMGGDTWYHQSENMDTPYVLDDVFKPQSR